MTNNPDRSGTTETHRPGDFMDATHLCFEGRLHFEFDADGLLIVQVAMAQHVLVEEEIEQLRNWLFAQGQEFSDDL